MTSDASSGASAATRVETEVAVIGAGPIGIVLALELAKSLQVTLVESGNWAPPGETQSLGDVERAERYHGDMRLATQRRVGGASNLWGGRCVPFDPIDFDQRGYAPNADWPLTFDDVAQYFQRAADWCRIGRAIFSTHDLPELADRSIVPGFTDGDVRASDLERWSLPTNFRREYGRLLLLHPNIELITGFTCTELVTGADDETIVGATCRSLDGRSLRLDAKQYVIAAGGIESARLLMVSASSKRPDGLGNRGGHLGRWYMSHVEGRTARVRWLTSPEDTIYAHERDADGVFVRRRFTFSADFQQKQRLPNSATWLVNPDVSDARHGSATLSLVYALLSSPLGSSFVSEAIRQKHLKADLSSPLSDHLANIRADWREAASFAAAFGYGRFLKQGRRLPGFFVASAENVYPLQYHGEHLPHWESRVELSNSRDVLGMKRLSTHLSFSASDISSVRRSMTALDEYLRDQRLGYLEDLYPDSDAAVGEQIFGGFHQAGVSRMSADPADGVVAPDLRVHECTNLYVASTGVLPSSGQANSTFTALGLAIRLADHLRRGAATPAASYPE